MPNSVQADPENNRARLAGLLYLGTIVFGLSAELAVRSRVRDPDPAVTLANIARLTRLYRMGEAADLVMLCCYIGVTVLLYRLLEKNGPVLALTAACFSLIGIAVLAVAGMLHMLPLVLLAGDVPAGTGRIAQLALDLHATLYGISLVFFGAYCVMIGLLCITSRRVPRLVGLLMILGGLTHVAMRLLWILAPAELHQVPRALAPLPLLGEAALAGWLLLFGMRRPGDI